MSDENLQPVFQIQRVYLKDMSLEQPNSPAIFLEQEAPAIEVALDVGAVRNRRWSLDYRAEPGLGWPGGRACAGSA